MAKRFLSVKIIDMVGTGKLRVTVGDWKQAHEIDVYALLTFVHLPNYKIDI